MSKTNSDIFNQDHITFKKRYESIASMTENEWSGDVGSLIAANKILVREFKIPPTMPVARVSDYNQFLSVWAEDNGRIYYKNELLQVPVDKEGNPVDAEKTSPAGYAIVERHEEYFIYNGIAHIYSENRVLTREEYEARVKEIRSQ